MLSLFVCSVGYLVGNASPCVASRSCDVYMSADVPSIVVGGGRIGSLLASLGDSVIMRRGDAFPDAPTDGPIYVTTRNDDLAGVIDATPPHRREDLVFMQNGKSASVVLRAGCHH